MEKSCDVTYTGKAGRETSSTVPIPRKHSRHPELQGQKLCWELAQIFTNGPKTELQSGICQEIKQKLSTYQSNDTRKGLGGGNVPEPDSVVEMMILEKGRCVYCHREWKVLYQNRRDPFQWSIDRIDNGQSHHLGNIVISCLQCNLQRRQRDAVEFFNSRNLRVVRD